MPSATDTDVPPGLAEMMSCALSVVVTKRPIPPKVVSEWKRTARPVTIVGV